MRSDGDDLVTVWRQATLGEFTREEDSASCQYSSKTPRSREYARHQLGPRIQRIRVSLLIHLLNTVELDVTRRRTVQFRAHDHDPHALVVGPR